jgi:chromosome partitioning protein
MQKRYQPKVNSESAKPMRKIAISNQKGGVGKTTTAANLSASVAELGKDVLIIDMDPQSNLSVHMGVEVQRNQPSVYALMRGECSPEDALYETPVAGLKLIPANIDLAGLEVELSTEPLGREKCLSNALQSIESDFDYIFIDCPPSLGLLTLNAMCAANEIFIPLQTEFFALQGLGRLMQTVRLVQKSLDSQTEVTGLIACMFDVRTSLATEVLEEIKQHFGDILFDTVVRKNVRLAEAPSFGTPVSAYDSDCYGTEDYRSLAREVINMTETTDQPAAEDSTPPLPDTPKQEIAKAS